MCSVSTPARNPVKSRLAVRMPFIARHPARSCPFGGRANISQDESPCMKAHTRSPVSTRRSNHAAYSDSPRTDNGDGVGANTSSVTVVAKSCSTHCDLTHLHSSSPTCEQDRFVGRNVSLLDPGVQVQVFHLLDFSFIASLDFIGRQSVDHGTLVACVNRQFSVRSSFLVDIEFHIVLTTDVKNVSCHSCLLRHIFIVDWFQLM